MTDNGYAHVALLIDRTGSMVDIRDKTNAGIAEFVKGLQDGADKRQTISLFDFDSTSMDEVVRFAALDDWPGYTLIPRANTPLLDAIFWSVTETGSQLKALAEDARPGFVTFVIVTDGQENASHEHTDVREIHDLIKRQTDDYGWTFMFLAANQDAIGTGRTLGVPVGNSANFTGRSVGSTYSVAAASTVGTYSGQSVDFPEDMPDDEA